MSRIPNLIHDDVPEGKMILKTLKLDVQVSQEFDFEAKAHWDILEDLQLADFNRAAKVSLHVSFIILVMVHV